MSSTTTGEAAGQHKLVQLGTERKAVGFGSGLDLEDEQSSA